MTRFVFILFCAAAISARAQGVSRADTNNVPVVTVCELLSNVSAYNGKLLIVLGQYRSWMEGVVLEEVCGATQQSIWLLDKSREVPLLDIPDYLRYRTTILAKLPAYEAVDMDMVVDCYYSGLWTAIFGRFETNELNPIDPTTGAKIGFGHLGGWQTQLVYPTAGFWCLVPPSRREALAQEMSDREERARVSMSRHLRAELESPEGPAFFEASVRGLIIQAVHGFVVSTDSKDHPKLIEVSVTDTVTPEAKLLLDKPLGRPLQPGTKISFDGIAVDFSPNPYRITFEVAETELRIGWGSH